MSYQQLLQSKYPEGSWGGQCGTFAHKLVNFPSVGNMLGAKLRSCLAFGIPYAKIDNFKVGDVVLENYPVFGHLAVINAIIGSKLQLTESNFNYDLKVHHTRQIDRADSRIFGVFRGALTYPIPPKVLQVKVVQKGLPWASMGDKYAEIRTRLLQYSNNKLDINLDTVFTNLDIPLTTQGYPINQGVDQNWYTANISPLGANYDFTCLLIPPLTQTSWGWFVPQTDVQVFTLENETNGSAEVEVMNDFVYKFLHELSHFLY